MHKNPLFTLLIGLVIGLVVGYVLAERQPVPPARAVLSGAPSQADAGLPEGHPPVAGADSGAANPAPPEAAELLQLLAQNPDDRGLMVALGNLYFDTQRWQEARTWYERALGPSGTDPNVITDLAVVYRNLNQPERSLELLERAIASSPDHWQAWYNKVVVLHFDLHRHDAAQSALNRLQALKQGNPAIPNLDSLAAEVGSS